jgi:serine/threonine protein kinase
MQFGDVTMPENQLQVDEVFAEALRRAAGPDRARYLDEVCGADQDLRGRVERLLRAASEAGSFLEAPANDPSPTVDQPPVEGPGTVIGPYKLIEQVGEGGMGSVWMAQQSEPVKRLVAVKLIKAGMDSKQVIARFEAERQALALMDHPNIAKVLDGGTTGAGRPYFVMDLVKGVPITRYCDEHHLTPRQRLELFLPVCQAVQHAHQKGIIHRDLKPSNVLVALYDGKPVPKVIDFGVAKAAGQPLTDKTLVTGFGSVVGTLEYMLPEQAEINQLDIDTRSDIYSLGVLLYELLAGSPPFTRKELETAGMLEMLRVIRELEPSKPSTKLSTAEGLPTLAANRGTEPAQLTRLVRGELDWIVMKALEKDRNRRYQTANGFAADVQRYLADEPVQACPPSAGYRLRKFARRNKGALAVAALVLFFLVLLGSGVGWAVRDRSAREAEAARQQAERQAKVAGQVESILADADRLEKEQKWPEALTAARRAEAVVAGGEADPATAERVRQRLKDLEFIDRLEQIRIQKAMSLDYAEANQDYARAFRDYGVDVDELAVETSIDRLQTRPSLAIPVAAALDDWFVVRKPVGTTADVAACKRLVAVARGIDPEPVRDRVRAILVQPASEVQDELRRLVESVDVRAQPPATLHLLARLKKIRFSDTVLRLLGDAQVLYPGDFWLSFELAEALEKKKDHEGATRFGTAAVAIRPNSALAHNNLGDVLRTQHKLDEAMRHFRKAIEISPTYAYAHVNLGCALGDQGKLDDAVAAFHVLNWVNAFLSGTSNEDVIAGFVGSDECYQTQKAGDPYNWLFTAYQDLLGRRPDYVGFQSWYHFLIAD